MGVEGHGYLILGSLLNAMNLPYFAIEGHDVTVFKSLETASQALEPPDVRSGVYRFFAHDGTELSLEEVKGRVIIGARVLGTHPGDLQTALRHYLAAVPSKRRLLNDAQLATAPLDQLVDEMVRVERQR